MNKVLGQALKDYDENIVYIDIDNISNLVFSDAQRNILLNSENVFFQHKSFKDCVRFLIGINSINYQFWDVKDNQFIRYQNKGQVGALGLFAGFEPLYEYLKINSFDTSLINKSVVDEYFGDIPDKDNRVSILREAFANFEEVFSLINNNPINVELAEKISHVLPLSYSDPYLKKIQLALYEIAHVHSPIECEITVAADYQIPKVLEGLNILQYSDELSSKIQHMELIEENSPEERSIRAATILACERITKTHDISVAALDKLLWLARNNFKDKNFHLTKTTKY